METDIKQHYAMAGRQKRDERFTGIHLNVFPQGAMVQYLGIQFSQ